MNAEKIFDIFTMLFFLSIGLGIIIGSFGILFKEIWFPFEGDWFRIAVFLIGIGIGGVFSFLAISELYEKVRT